MMKIASLSDVALFLAQTPAPAAPAGQSGGFGSTIWIFYGLLFAGMYFLVIAPQKKKQKEQQKMLDNLETGDEVLTAGGIFGEVANRKGDRVVLRVSDTTKIEVAKSFIQTVVKKSGAEEVAKK